MFKKIAVVLALVIAALVAFVATRPDTFSVERSITVAAPAALVFPYVNDFHRWDEFSPWNERDLAMKKEYSGAEAGVGAVYAWSGNDQVGTGSMRIVESSVDMGARYKIGFTDPWQSESDTAILFAADGAQTRVTWSMSGDNTFMSKAFSLVMDMDTMIGKDFEQGLAKLKTLAEADAEKAEAERKAAEAAAAEAAAEVAPTDAPAEQAVQTP